MAIRVHDETVRADEGDSSNAEASCLLSSEKELGYFHRHSDQSSFSRLTTKLRVNDFSIVAHGADLESKAGSRRSADQSNEKCLPQLFWRLTDASRT